MTSRGLSSPKRTKRQNKHNSILLESYSLSAIPRSTSIGATSTASCDSTDADTERNTIRRKKGRRQIADDQVVKNDGEDNFLRQSNHKEPPLREGISAYAVHGHQGSRNMFMRKLLKTREQRQILNGN